MLVHTVKPDEDLQEVKLVSILKNCKFVLVPDEVEENLESACLASECDAMVVSYSDAKAVFNRISDLLKELKER